MTVRDVLLVASSHPEPTPTAAVESAAAFAAARGARLTVLVVDVDIPRAANAMADALLGLSAMTASEQAKSDAAAAAIAEAARAACAREGVAHEVVVERGVVSEVPFIALEYARVRDLTLLPLDGDASLQRFVAEAIVFGAGRPVLVLPPGGVAPTAIRGAVVAWDYGRAAARAVADALPLLQEAKDVRVLTIVNEKDLGARRSGAELTRHLAHHDVKARLEEVDAAGRTAAAVIEAAVRAEPTDLLVIGAFGHSRLRDFVLGGVTRAMLAAPPVPLLLTH